MGKDILMGEAGRAYNESVERVNKRSQGGKRRVHKKAKYHPSEIVRKVRSSDFRRKFVSWFSRKLPTSAWSPNYELFRIVSDVGGI